MCDECENDEKMEEQKEVIPRLVRNQLGRDANTLGEQKARTDRALSILELHPEFELVFELLSLIGHDAISIQPTHAITPVVSGLPRKRF